jgi:hypothetical protein
MNLSFKKMFCRVQIQTQRRDYVRVNERTVLDNASTNAASHQLIEAAPEYKNKEKKRDLERSLRNGGNDKSGMDKRQNPR